MKRIRSLALALALAAFSGSSVHAATAEELVVGLRIEIEKSLAEAKSGKSASSYYSGDIERQITRLESAIAKDNFEEVEQCLSQLAVLKLSAEAKEKISQLQKELPKLAEERQKAVATQVAATIEKAGKACLAAKTEADLDPVLVELNALKKSRSDSYSGIGEARQRLNTRIDGTVRFVTRWQDALAQSSRGFDAAARAILRELAEPSGSNAYYPILQKSEIVARLGKDGETTGEDVARAVKSLDELPKAIAEVNRLAREIRSGGFEGNTLGNELSQISRAYAAFQGGNYAAAVTTLGQYEAGANFRSAESIRLKTMLMLQVIPKYLELPDNPQPKAGENPSDFLMRIAEEGAAQQDWARVTRALDTYRLVAFGTRQAPAWIVSDLDACQQFVAAQNLEKSRRMVSAILAYQRAVKSSGKFNPQKQASERLAALEKEYPQEFKDAGKEPQVRELLEAISKNAPASSIAF